MCQPHYLAGHLVALCNAQRVDAHVQQRLGMLQQRASEHHHARCAIADLLILRPRVSTGRFTHYDLAMQLKSVHNGQRGSVRVCAGTSMCLASWCFLVHRAACCLLLVPLLGATCSLNSLHRCQSLHCCELS